MPNHVQNKLRIIGDANRVKEIMHHIQDKYDDGDIMRIDFSKITPRPECLDIESNGFLSPLENPFSQNTSFLAQVNSLKDFIAKVPPERAEKELQNFIQGIKNYVQLGYATWYTWSTENWGTKWNAYDQLDTRNSEDTIYFNTAWSAPVPVIIELSKKFPDVAIELTYADEDSGSNTGRLIFEKGALVEGYKPESQSKDAYDIYFELHPDSRENFELIDGIYQYKDDDED